MKRLIKRACSYMLVTALVITMVGMTNFGVVTGDSNNGNINVQAEEVAATEPSINESSDILLYSKDSIELDGSTTHIYNFGLTIPSSEEYCISFVAKSTNNVYINFRESDNNGRIVLATNQYGLLKFNNSALGWPDYGKYISKTTTLTTGTKVTIKSDGNKASVWIDGECLVEDGPLAITGTNGVPKISWAETAATFTDVKIWKAGKFPYYSENEDTLLYSKDSVELDGSTTHTYDFGVTIPASKEYCMSFTAKSTGNVFINFREGDDNGRILLASNQYGLLKFNNSELGWTNDSKYISKTTTLKTGTKVTIKSDGNKASVWIDGECMIEDGPLAITGTNGIPKIAWVAAATTFTNVRIWQEGKVESDEPEYNEQIDTLIINESERNVPEERNSFYDISIPSTKSYYMSLTVQAGMGVNVGFRQGDYYFNMESGGYKLKGTKDEDQWHTEGTGLAKGAKVTIYSTPNKVTIWLNGNKIYDECELKASGLAIKAGITWAFAGGVKVTNAKVWLREKVSVVTVGTTKTIAVDNKVTLGSATYGWYNEGKMFKAGATVEVSDGMKFTPVNKLEVVMTAGASIKINDDKSSGIRFKSTITSDNMPAVDSDAIKAGTLITANDIYEESGTLEKTSKYSFVNIENSGWYKDEKGSYCGAIVNINENNYTRPFIARAYVTVKYADNTEKTIYSEMSDVRTISGMAKMIQEREYKGVEKYKDIIDKLAMSDIG